MNNKLLILASILLLVGAAATTFLLAARVASLRSQEPAVVPTPTPVIFEEEEIYVEAEPVEKNGDLAECGLICRDSCSVFTEQEESVACLRECGRFCEERY